MAGTLSTTPSNTIGYSKVPETKSNVRIKGMHPASVNKETASSTYTTFATDMKTDASNV
ncbi:hypothetical protein BPY_05800 [Bifidobacterium psychraerophilum]